MRPMPSCFLAAGVAIVSCAPPARTAHEAPSVRTVHVAQELALAAMTNEFQITERADGRVDGRFWATSGSVNRRTLEQRYGCRAKAVARDDETWICIPASGRINWRMVLDSLDHVGIMAPPPDDTPPSMMCNDGTPWRIVVYGRQRADSVTSARGCGPVSQPRIVFDRGIESIIGSVVRQVERQP